LMSAVFELRFIKKIVIEHNVNALAIIYWRASLVPAAAVIPAPIAYINIVAVKKLIV
jgi:hypothetical protein